VSNLDKGCGACYGKGSTYHITYYIADDIPSAQQNVQPLVQELDTAGLQLLRIHPLDHWQKHKVWILPQKAHLGYPNAKASI
jgi:hypothetical protein